MALHDLEAQPGLLEVVAHRQPRLSAADDQNIY
jgi:hypothetical protein